MSSLRPEWPGDGPRRAPEGPRDRRSGEHARHAPRPPQGQWSGERVRGAPGPAQDQWSGYEQQPYEQRQYEQQPYRQQPSGQGVPRINPVAIASLLCGITLILDLFGFLGSLLVAIPAIICGGIALWQINNRGERGQGMAIAGLGIGLIGILLFIVVQG